MMIPAWLQFFSDIYCKYFRHKTVSSIDKKITRKRPQPASRPIHSSQVIENWFFWEPSPQVDRFEKGLNLEKTGVGLQKLENSSLAEFAAEIHRDGDQVYLVAPQHHGATSI